MPYRQGDPRWGEMRIGQTGKTMARYGCYTTVVASFLAGTYQKKNGKDEPINPGDLCGMLNEIGGYDGDAQLQWDAVRRLFPDCGLWSGAWTQSLKSRNFQLVNQDEALRRLRRAVRMGIGVGVCVDAVKDDNVKPDHIVALTHAPEDAGLWRIMDPITGREHLITERYGHPNEIVLGYRVVAGPPTAFPTYSTADDMSRGVAFWKAVEVAGGRNVGTYAEEIAQHLLFII